jgi:ubiquinone biosynthesis protein COQ4
MTEFRYSKFRFIRIMQAIRLLVADKEDTKQVFIILEALGRRSGKKTFARFMASKQSKAILAADKSLLDYLSDRAWLKTLPLGSLGQKYYDFTESEQITADGLVDASVDGRMSVEILSADEKRFRERSRDAHDLWHVTTGYGRDALGELSLLAFTYRQMGNWGFLFIIFFGLKIMRSQAPSIAAWPAIREGFRMGKQANWLGAADWERLLTLPLEQVRAELKIGKPDVYRDTSMRIMEFMGAK